MKRSGVHEASKILTTVGFLFLIGLAVLYAFMGYWIASMVFLLLTILFIWLCGDVFYTFMMNENGVTKRALWKQSTLKWENVQEAGVLPSNAMKRKRLDKRASHCTIYYSPRRLDLQERLAACMHTPKDIITLPYTAENMRETTLHWPKRLILFNITTRELFGNDANLLDLNVQEIRY